MTKQNKALIYSGAALTIGVLAFLFIRHSKNNSLESYKNKKKADNIWLGVSDTEVASTFLTDKDIPIVDLTLPDQGANVVINPDGTVTRSMTKRGG